MMQLALLAFTQVAHLHGSDFSVSPEFNELLREVFPEMPQPKGARGPKPDDGKSEKQAEGDTDKPDGGATV